MSIPIEVGSVSAEQAAKNTDEINLTLLTHRLVVLPTGVIEAASDIALPPGSRLAGLGQRQTRLNAEYIVTTAPEETDWLHTKYEFRPPGSKRPWRYSPGSVDKVAVNRGLRIENLSCNSILLSDCIDVEIERVECPLIIFRRCANVKMIDVDSQRVEWLNVSDSIMERVRTNAAQFDSCVDGLINNSKFIGSYPKQNDCWGLIFTNCRQEAF